MGIRRKNNIRIRIAQESARIILESGVKDYLLAKKKAARLLNCRDKNLFPSNQEIEVALQEYQSLFHAELHIDTLLTQRKAALEAMVFLKQFHPRLVGRVLLGTATKYSAIILHIFADAAEEVMMYLLDNGIPFETGLRQLRYKNNSTVDYPAYTFEAGDFSIQLVVLPMAGLREAPCSPVDGAVMVRAGLSAVEAMLVSENHKEKGTGL